MSWPSTPTVPALGVTMPQTMLINVVLPAPFGPSRAKISPRRIPRLTPFSACKPDAYVFVRPEISIMTEESKASAVRRVSAAIDRVHLVGVEGEVLLDRRDRLERALVAPDRVALGAP